MEVLNAHDLKKEGGFFTGKMEPLYVHEIRAGTWRDFEEEEPVEQMGFEGEEPVEEDDLLARIVAEEIASLLAS